MILIVGLLFNCVVAKYSISDISALFLECTKSHECSIREKSVVHNLTIGYNQQIKNGLQTHVTVEDCQRKLYITLHLINSHKISGDDEFVVVDDVIDPITGNASHLLYPIAMKLRRKQPQIVYPLKFLKIVNGGALEVASSREESKVCQDINCAGALKSDVCCSEKKENRIDHATLHSKRNIILNGAGLVLVPANNVNLPYPNCKDLNQSCSNLRQFFFETDKSILRDILKMNGSNQESYIGQKQTAKKKFMSNKRSIPYRESFRTRIDRERLQKVAGTKSNLTRHDPRRCDRRSGCSDHCIKFSDLWYSVYAFDEPYVIQEIDLQLFQKEGNINDKPSYWKDLTRGNVIRLGTQFPIATDEIPTISLSFSTSLNTKGCNEVQCPIDYKSNFLLVPSHIQNLSNLKSHPEATGGPGEYLVVPQNKLARQGSSCSNIHSLTKNAKNQKNSCQSIYKRCLKDQPVDLWITEMEHRINGRTGRYFLDNFGSIAGDTLQSQHIVAPGDSLALDYTAPFESVINVELRADSNALGRTGWNIKIQSITSDSLGQQEIVLDVVVINNGLVPGDFRPWLVDCTETIPVFSSGPYFFLQPLHHHVFQIHMLGSLPTPTISCTVEVMNRQTQRVASRQVVIKKQARCICAFHCVCNCLQSTGVSCMALMQEEYVAAGYRGGLPHTPDIPAQIPLLVTPLNVILTTLCLLLLLGKLKVAFGCCFGAIRTFGLDFICYGIGIFLTPVSDKPSVEEFLNGAGPRIVMNMFFFLLYPAMMLVKLCCMLPISACMEIRRSDMSDNSDSRPSNDGLSSSEVISDTQSKYSCEDIDARYVIAYLQAKDSFSY